MSRSAITLAATPKLRLTSGSMADCNRDWRPQCRRQRPRYRRSEAKEVGDRSTTPPLLDARHDRQRDMRLKSKVVETAWRSRTTDLQTGGQTGSTSVSSRRGIGAKNSRDSPSEPLLVHTRKSLAQFDQMAPLDSVEFFLHSSASLVMGFA